MTEREPYVEVRMSEPRRVSDEWARSVVAAGGIDKLPGINLVTSMDVCADLLDARAENAKLREALKAADALLTRACRALGQDASALAIRVAVSDWTRAAVAPSPATEGTETP